MITSVSHTSVTSDDMVTVTVTSHKIYGRILNILEEIMSYNM